MKRVACLSLALTLGAVCPSVRAEDVLPRPAAGDRYLKMADRSPFAPPTAERVIQPTAPPPPGPKWSDQLAVTLLTQQGGIYFATIFDKEKNERFLLQSNREDTDRQLALSSVQWGEVFDQTTVTLRHNSEFAPVRFDASAGAAASVINPSLPGRPLGVPAPPPGQAGQPRFVPPPPPNMPAGMQSPPNVVRRPTPIRTAPTVNAPAARPAPNVVRRPVNKEDDDE